MTCENCGHEAIAHVALYDNVGEEERLEKVGHYCVHGQGLGEKCPCEGFQRFVSVVKDLEEA